MNSYYATARRVPLVLLILTVTSCKIPNEVVVLDLDFSTDWTAGFADYPVGEETFYELTSGYEQLPPPLEKSSGLIVSGNNHSDDLFMFVKKRFSGLAPNSRYQLQFKITFATNAPSGCIGVGGPPGEGVAIKAGATIREPLPYDDGSGFYLMDVDKGNQFTGGSDAIVIGDFANTKKCEDGDLSYELKTLSNEKSPFEVITYNNGELWILFGTDSGYEATTSIYYVSGSIVATKM